MGKPQKRRMRVCYSATGLHDIGRLPLELQTSLPSFCRAYLVVKPSGGLTERTGKLLISGGAVSPQTVPAELQNGVDLTRSHSSYI